VITYNNLYEQISSFENLHAAAMLAKKGKIYENAIGRYFTNLESELLVLNRSLKDHSYQAGGWKFRNGLTSITDCV